MGTAPDEVLIEFVSLGNAVKVTAVDPVTATEVSIVGDPRAGRDALSALAIRKLHHVLAAGKTDAPAQPGRGLVI